MLLLLRLANKTILQIHFEFAYFSVLLIWNWSDKYIHTLCSSLENQSRFQNKKGKVDHPFLDQKGAKTIPDVAAHTYTAYIRECPPPRGVAHPKSLIMSVTLAYYSVSRTVLLYVGPFPEHRYLFLKTGLKPHLHIPALVKLGMYMQS